MTRVTKDLCLTKTDLHHIKRRYEAGESLGSLGKAYKKDHTTILYHLKNMGVELRGKNKFMCEEPGCRKSVVVEGYCVKHNSLVYVNRAEDLNHLVPRRPLFMGMSPEALEEKLHPTPVRRCDHTRSDCACINPGKYYNEYNKKIIHE